MKKASLLLVAVIVFSMIACASVSIESVDWDSLKGPAKVRQYLSVSTTEVSVYANYKDASRKEVTFLSVSHDRDKTGMQTATVSIVGQGSGTFQTEVMEMTGIRVESPPKKTSYTVGEKADLAGIRVMGSWIDFPDAEIPAYQVSVSRFDSGSAGNNRLVTVEFKGKTATFPVTVTAAAAAAPAPAASATPAPSAPAASQPSQQQPSTQQSTLQGQPDQRYVGAWRSPVAEPNTPSASTTTIRLNADGTCTITVALLDGTKSIAMNVIWSSSGNTFYYRLADFPNDPVFTGTFSGNTLTLNNDAITYTRQ